MSRQATNARKRHGGQISEDEGLAGAGPRSRTRRRLVGAGPTLKQQPEAESMITARMPIMALTTEWSLGRNRPLDPRHVQKLSKRFIAEGGPKREATQNHLKVLVSGADVRRMMEQLGLSEADFDAVKVMADFSGWMAVNGERKAEVLAGQHRIQALEEFVQHARCGTEELWWPCKFYDRGKRSRG